MYTIFFVADLKEEENRRQFEKKHANDRKRIYNSNIRRVKQKVTENEGIEIYTPNNAEYKGTMNEFFSLILLIYLFFYN